MAVGMLAMMLLAALLAGAEAYARGRVGRVQPERGLQLAP